MNTLKVAVVIGRFQPLLAGQIEHVLKPAIENSDLAIILLGSSIRARTHVDPLTWKQRMDMILDAVDEFNPMNGRFERGKLVFHPLRDYMYSENDWIVEVQSLVSNTIGETLYNPKNVEVTLYGAETDKNAKKYHGWFPQWNVKLARVDWLDDPADSDILTAMYHRSPDLVTESDVTRSTYDFLMNWLDTSEGRRLTEEYDYIDTYKRRTQSGKYPIQFQTVDSVAIYKGNVLLVKRRSQPGRGLWALPGGFLEVEETCQEGAVRELQEETGLRVKPEWLVSREIFDHPHRSTRGRTITNAFLWKIPDYRQVPQVKAGSDASRTKWFPLAHVLENMQDQMFEDHMDIIETLIKRLP
jgi:bifunctional NMN adenylyltransferase/nudix hydrolase